MSHFPSCGINRRELMRDLTALTLASGAFATTRGDESPQAEDAKLSSAPSELPPKPVAIATWNFGQIGTDAALEVLRRGGTTLDAVEEGIRRVEASGGSSVGLTGRPNGAGFVQQDACIMHGPGHRAGSVAAIEGVRHPISAARQVMEQTRHVMLVGAAAREFAIRAGLETVPVDDHAEKASEWWSRVTLPQKLRDFEQPPEGLVPAHDARDDHDTVTLLVLAVDGTISGGCSTSGLANKFPGRVGDSPILGSGLYVDQEVGAAGATGIGEDIMRYVASARIVETMRRGATPREAIEEVVRFIRHHEPGGEPLEIFFIALDRHGRCGAGGTGEFPHAVAYPEFSQVLVAPPVS